MFKKLLLLIALSLAFIVAKAPASLLDSLLAHFTEGGLHLQQAEGSLWHGRGVLASRAADGRSLTPWLPLGWHFDTAALTRLALGWSLDSAGTPLGQVEAGPTGMSVAQLALHAPVDAAVSPLPHPAARAGWQGDLSLEVPAWHCPPDGRCSGEARLLWRGARAALFPGRNFGDYEIHLQAKDGHLHYSLQTLAGEVRAQGSGEVAPGGLPSFDGQLSGDPEFLKRLPSIAAGAARPTGQPGQFEIHWPPH